MSNTSNPSCILGPSVDVIKDQLYFVTHFIFTPIYFIIVLFTRSVGLAAFYRLYKKENDLAFTYQMVVWIGDILSAITLIINIVTLGRLSGFRVEGALWFQQSHFLMLISAHFSPTTNGFLQISLLLLTSAAADRAFALAKPFVYKNINHKRHQFVAILSSIVIGYGTSIFHAWHFNAEWKSELDRYKIVFDQDFEKSTTAMSVLPWISNIVRMAGLFFLNLFNITAIVCFRMKVGKVGNLPPSNDTIKKKRSNEKTLMLLTVWQSICMAITTFVYVVFYTLTYSKPGFSACEGSVMTPLVSLAVEVVGILEFFVLLAVSKQFREVIFKFLRLK